MNTIGYEVTLQVDADIADDYLAWLRRHVQAMLRLPGFLDARVAERVDPAPAPGERVFCCLYRLRDRAALEAYLREHALRMRADGERRFGGRFLASRRVLETLADY
ncbi:DUF4286 family protein [Arenimonas fontis]|uniref:DUF4286 family protein n=1 Tax=Arenimonas fontis TaxID=2608255 RepID=UPI0016620150|nr:DUF4286 family protein [Arenimonas fontis]